VGFDAPERVLAALVGAPMASSWSGGLDRLDPTPSRRTC
jgi:hypothetical protein